MALVDVPHGFYEGDPTTVGGVHHIQPNVRPTWKNFYDQKIKGLQEITIKKAKNLKR